MPLAKDKLQQKFYSAILKGDATILANIINNNKVDITMAIGDTTPLVYSARNNHINAVKVLLKAGANPNEIERTGTSALRWASYNKNRKLVRLLLRYNANPNLQNISNGTTALHIATKQNDIKTVKLLLNAHAKVSLKQEGGKTPLDCAKDFNASSKLILLLEQAERLKNKRTSSFRKYCKTKHNQIK